jgi:hypothetical protein
LSVIWLERLLRVALASSFFRSFGAKKFDSAVFSKHYAEFLSADGGSG